jgi:vacuolar-type H+-ATPase subunit F/Vma7
MAVIGTVEDVAGFALAGIPGQVCDTGPVVREALDAARRDREVAVIVLSAEAERLAPDAVRAAREAGGLPLVVVLPVGTGGRV